MKWTCPRFVVLLGIALTIWLWPSVFGGKAFVPLDILAHNPPQAAPAGEHVHNGLIGDWLFENYIWKLFQRRALAAGELPLWNAATFCGHPLYTSGQASTFYPLNVIFLLVPLPQAFVVFVWVHLLLAGVLAYLLFRRLEVGPFGAAVGGLSFAMSGFLAVHLVFPMLLASGVWLPLMLAWVDRVAEPVAAAQRRRWMLAGAVLFAMPLLGGFFEIAFYAYVAAAVFAVVHAGRLTQADSFRRAGRYLGRVGAVMGLGVLLAAPQLLPFFEVMHRNVRAGRNDYRAAVGSALAPYELLNAIVPDALGNPAVHQGFSLGERRWAPITAPGGADFHYFGPKNYVEVGFYFGVLPLALALLSIRAAARERVAFLLLIAVALAFALGTPLYRLFYYLVPGSEQVRTPFRWMFLAAFAGTYFAAVGGQHWYERLGQRTRRAARIGGGAAALAMLMVLAAVVLMLVWPTPVEAMARYLLQADARARANFRTADELAGLLWLNGLRCTVFAALAAVMIALAYWRRWTPRQVGVISVAALALLALDLGQASFRFNTHADPAVLARRPPLIQQLQADRGTFRIGRFGPDKVLYANLPLLHGLQDYGGYDSIILRDYVRFMEAIEPQKLLPYNIVMTLEEPGSLDSPLLPLLNIRYLLTARPLAHRDWQEVPVVGDLKLYRIRPERELPRAFLVDAVRPADSPADAIGQLRSGRVDVFHTAVIEASPASAAGLAEAAAGERGTAEILGYRNNSVRVQTQADGRRLLVLGDVNYPGWNASIDGRPEEVFTTNGIFRGVSVPAGRHVVDFRFQPFSFRLGCVLSGVCLLLLVGAAARPARKHQPGGA